MYIFIEILFFSGVISYFANSIYINSDEIDKYAVLSVDNQCALCHRNFSGKDKLKRHLSEKHVINRVRYQCDICLKTFCRQDYVYTHKRSIHGVFTWLFLPCKYLVTICNKIIMHSVAVAVFCFSNFKLIFILRS